MDILPTRGPRAFAVFVDSLRSEYDWLADALEEELAEDEEDEVFDEGDGGSQVDVSWKFIISGFVP